MVLSGVVILSKECEVLDLVVLSGIVILSKECAMMSTKEDDVLGEVLGLVVLSGVVILSKECEDVDEGRRRSRGRSLISWCCAV